MKTKKKNTLFRLIGYTKPYAPLIVISFIASILSVAVSILIPLMSGYAIDYMLGKDKVDFDKVLEYVYIIVGMIVVGAIAQWTLTASVNSLTCKTVRNIRNGLFEHINNLPLKYIDTQRQGDIIARISSDIDQVSEGLLQGFTQLFSGVLTIGATLGILFYLNWIIALVVLLLTPLSLFVAAFITKRSHKTFSAQAVKRGEVSGYVEEIFTGRNLIQAFCQEDICQEDFEKLNKELYDCGFKSQFYGALINPCTRFVNNLVYASVGVVGAFLALKTGSMELKVGLLSTCLSYANQYTKPFNEITGVITEIQSAVAASRRIFNLLDQEVEESDKDNEVLEVCDGTLDIDDVYFSYTSEKPLIQGLNLHVKQGQKIAIVGPTGCGKTTLINLLMRFYDVNSGSISMSNKDIRQITRTSLRDNYGMVLQESWLFEGTIRDNIAYGKQDASLEEIMQAAKLAGADDFIEKFPDKYDTLLTENGDNISQGQRQLLCIARIMLTHPPMLILDEATSSIDTRTEMKIQEAFYRIMQGRTSFIVAHRLSTIRSCDVILVMKDGNIIEQGNHEELLAKRGFYFDLYNSQFVGSNAS